MQVNIKLALKTREVFKLFERRIDGDRLFIEAILHKFNIVIRQCRQQIPGAMNTYNQMEQAMIMLTQQFREEMTRFYAVLTRRKNFNDKEINLISQFHPTINVSSTLSIQLIELLETYDQLIATLKLLQLTELFESNDIYFYNVKRIQKLANKTLSCIMLAMNK